MSLFPLSDERIGTRISGFGGLICGRFNGSLSLHGLCRIAREMKTDGSRNAERSEDARRPEALQNGRFLLGINSG